jgi:hypothetical protein
MKSGVLDRFTVAALAVGFAALYLITRSARPDPDALAFARLAGSGLGTPGFFQAEHVLYPFWGWVAYQAARLGGYGGPPDEPMAALNALAGAVVVADVYRLGRVLRPDSRGVGLGAAALTGLSYAHWLHSTQAESQIVANALVLTAIALGLGAGRASLAGGLAGLGALSHGTAALPALVFGLWLALRSWAAAGGYWAGLVGVASTGLLLGAAAAGAESWAGVFSWLGDRPAAGIWGRLALADLPVGLKTAAGALFWPAGQVSLRDLVSTPLNPAGWFTAAAFVCVLGLAGIGLIGWFLGLKYRHPAGILVGGWAGVVGLFALGWAPEDPQFWTLWVPPVALGIGNVLLPEAGARRPWPPLGLVLAAAVLGVGLTNYALVFRPAADPANNPDLARARCLAAMLRSNDVVITLGWDWADGYLPRLGGWKVVSILDTYLRSAGRDPARLQALLTGEVRAARAAGGRAYLVHWPELTDPEKAWLARKGGPGPESLSLETRPRARCGDQTILEIVSP